MSFSMARCTALSVIAARGEGGRPVHLRPSAAPHRFHARSRGPSTVARAAAAKKKRRGSSGRPSSPNPSPSTPATTSASLSEDAVDEGPPAMSCHWGDTAGATLLLEGCTVAVGSNELITGE